VNDLHDIRVEKYIINEMLANTWQETEYHPYACHANNGDQTEIY
jgi:hypothetical protein